MPLFTYQFWIKQCFLGTECCCFRLLKLPLRSLTNLIIKCLCSRSHEVLFLQKFSKELSAFHSCDETNQNKGRGKQGVSPPKFLVKIFSCIFPSLISKLY